MKARFIDGKAIAQKVRDEVKAEVARFAAVHGRAPGLSVVVVSDAAGLEEHVAAWCVMLEAAGAADADVLHLHHLTPINEAAARVAQDRAVR